MLNIEKFADEIKEQITDGDSIACAVQNLKNNGSYSCQLCTAREVDALNWLLQEYKEPILAEEEKRIIKDIIKALKPFGKELSYITKESWNCDERSCYLNFKYGADNSGTLTFNSDKLFKGMKVGNVYTLDELELYKEVEN